MLGNILVVMSIELHVLSRTATQLKSIQPIIVLGNILFVMSIELHVLSRTATQLKSIQPIIIVENITYYLLSIIY